MAEQTKVDEPRDDDVFYSRLTVKDRAHGVRVAKEYKLDVTDAEVDDKGRVALSVLATKAQIERLQSAGLQVEVGENASAMGRVRQAEVAPGDRFDGGRIPPKGLGRKIREDR